MSFELSVALLALIVAVFAVLAAYAVFLRLRSLERTALAPGATLMVPTSRPAPADLQRQRPVLALLLNVTCPVCHALVEETARYVAVTPSVPVEVVAVLPPGAPADAGPFEALVNADVWQYLDEGYAPCVYLIDRRGEIVDRRFVYGDTDIPAVLADTLRAIEPEHRTTKAVEA
jgi:hypothetical protein